jgi:hypothetical protein
MRILEADSSTCHALRLTSSKAGPGLGAITSNSPVRLLALLLALFYQAYFPDVGAYTLAEIDVDIYTRPDDDSTPLPDNGGRPFVVPGGPVQTCPQVGAVNATSTSTSPFTKIASNIVCPTKPAPDPSTGAELGGRCGGGGWEGPFHCKEGTCKPLNFYQWFCTLDEE